MAAAVSEASNTRCPDWLTDTFTNDWLDDGLHACLLAWSLARLLACLLLLHAGRTWPAAKITSWAMEGGTMVTTLALPPSLKP